MKKNLFEKANSIILLNFHEHWKNPIVNKYRNDGESEASEAYEGFLILRKGKKPLWLSHPFNYEQVKKIKGIEVKTYNDRKDLQKHILNSAAGKTIGFDSKFTSVSQYKSIKKMLKGKKLIDVSEELGSSRDLKDTLEIEKIREAVLATNNALDYAKKIATAGMTEKELARKITNELDEKGYKTTFCIVAFGENTSHIHHTPTSAKLEINSPILIDCGAKCAGYTADITQTFWFGEMKGKEYTEFEKERVKVEKCLNKVSLALKPGIKAKSLWKYTKTLGKMPHALGHGIGLEGHDHPGGIGEKSKFKLEEGMVLAIEPGFYGKKFGIRIEKDYLITKKGSQEL